MTKNVNSYPVNNFKDAKKVIEENVSSDMFDAMEVVRFFVSHNNKCH